MFKSLEKSANVPGQLGFNFDIVVVLIDLKNINIEESSKLTIDVKFNNNNLKITSSRINVNEFKPGRSFEISERPSILKDKLLKNPLECQVYYNNQHIGTSSFLWPESFISCIAGGCGRELTRCDDADIKKNDQKVGRMEIITRLQIKCQEFEEKQLLQPKLNFCNADDNVLNPNDVMFVVGKTNSSFSCSDVGVIPGSSSGSSANATCLDLSDFRHVHGKTLSNANILDSIGTKCCKKKESTNQYKDIIKNLLDKANELASCPKKDSIQQLNQPSCVQQIKSMDCISETSPVSCSSSDSCQPHYCISDENAYDGKSMTSLRAKPTKRHCPLCHDDITWLPRFVACPKCGFKSISYNVEEKSYDHTITANKILQEYVNYAPDTKQSDSCQQKCRCSCRDGKICAHCRIKTLCQDIFQTGHFGKEDYGKCEYKSSDLYNICNTNSRDCRPYLTKVFQDLKELFEINEAKKNSNKIGRNVLNKTLKTFENVNTSVFQKRQLQDKHHKSTNVDKFQRSEEQEKINDEQRKKFTVHKNKIFDCNEQRKQRGAKFGHETCLAGRKIVPRKMGWLWNADENRFRSGWMPGAIRKPIKVLMQHFLNKNKLHSSGDFEINKDCNKPLIEEKDYTKESTLHICKKNGDYYITLRPLKAIGSLQECSESYLNMQPIQFKITKNPVLLGRRKLKQDLKHQGFAKCTCHQPIQKCCCRSFLERKKLEYQCCKECNKRDIPNCIDNLILSDTSESEAEFDFGVTPPAGVFQPDSCLKKTKKVSSATQYEENDWKIEQKNPEPLKKYFKLHNCAVGNRFGKQFGPYGNKGYGPGAIPIEGIYGPCGIKQEKISGKSAKYGRGMALTGPEAFRGPDGKFNMAQYLAYKDLMKPSPEEMIERRRKKMKLLKGANPPLLCKIDRRGKPINFCAPCLSDDRIC